MEFLEYDKIYKQKMKEMRDDAGRIGSIERGRETMQYLHKLEVETFKDKPWYKL